MSWQIIWQAISVPNDGQYRTVNLMPGAYEVWAEKGRLKSEYLLLRIQAGQIRSG